MKFIVPLVDAYIRTPQHRGKWRVVRALLSLVGEVPVKSKYGVLMYANAKDATNVWAITGNYDDVFSEVMLLEPGMCFIDIGANAGVFSLVAGQRVGTSGSVLSFEPSLSLFRYLIANAHANGLSGNFHPFLAAVGDQTRIARFDTGKDSHSGIAHLSEEGNVTVLQMSFVDIRSLIEKLVGDRVVVTKIDVEGAEYLVLKELMSLLGSIAISKIIVEVDGENLARFGHTVEEIYELLGEAGFSPRLGLTKQSHHHYNEIFTRPLNQEANKTGASGHAIS